jgi:hypothetical protein
MMRRRVNLVIRTALLMAASVVAAACGSGPRTEMPLVALVDTFVSASEEGPDEAVVHRVEVRFGVFTDTLSGVLAATLPVVTPDGEVTGIAWDEGSPVRGFFYDPGTEHLQPVPLPEQFVAYAIAPDGRHIAYTTSRLDGIVAVVRTWPAGDIVAEGAPAGGYPSDLSYDVVEWLDRDRFRISQRLDHFSMGLAGDYRTEVYQRTSGSVRRPGVQTDTTITTD